MRVWAAFCQMARDWPHPVMAHNLRLRVQNRRLEADKRSLTIALGQSSNRYENDRKRLLSALYERDEALALVVDLRHELAALEKVNGLLMKACPQDASELGEAS